MVNLWIALGVLVFVLGAEWLHRRRMRRLAYLAFGPRGRARGWAEWTSRLGVRAVLAALAAWGLLTLLGVDGAPVAPVTQEKPKRRLLICLDVSPSMDLKDAGNDSKTARDTRARQALKSLLERLDLSSTRVSVVAFYTTAKPAVIDTWDLNVVNNLLDDLPLEYAFKEGPTSLYAGVRESFLLASKWPRNSTTLVIVSDGDTLPDTQAPRAPESISNVIILGVGDPYRGTSIAGRTSKQDASSLKALAARLRGTYFDANQRQLPTSVVRSLWSSQDEARAYPGERTLGLVATGVGGGGLALLWPLLVLAGARAREDVGRERVGGDEEVDRTEDLGAGTGVRQGGTRTQGQQERMARQAESRVLAQGVPA